ncbi:MAG: polysaccharide biosynthesis/export family protein [Gemmatimonadales bacterium]
MPISFLRNLVFTAVVVLAAAGSADGQGAPPLQSRHAQASRTELESALTEAQQIVASPGYSSRLKDSKRREIALIKLRLEEGDLQPGDQVILFVPNEQTLSNTFIVGPGRVISLPGIPDISVKGVLRAEVQEFLTTELKKYLRDPTVRAQSTIRLSFLGGVGRPGFYQVPAEVLIGDAIMAAGGPAGTTDPANTKVQRAGDEILTKESFRQAMIDGLTIDQLNLRAGDEIIVGGARVQGGSTFWRQVVPLAGAALSVTYLIGRLANLF